VLWSHANGSVPWEATHFSTLLASHGFVVVAPANTGNTAETCPQPCVDTYPSARAARDEARANRPDHLIAAFDQSLQLSNGEDPLLTGLLIWRGSVRQATPTAHRARYECLVWTHVSEREWQWPAASFHHCWRRCQ